MKKRLTPHPSPHGEGSWNTFYLKFNLIYIILY